MQATRRAALIRLGGLLTLPLAGACQRQLDRAGVLRALVLDVVVPNTRALVIESRRLDVAVRAAANGERELGEARSVLRRTLLTWKRAYAFRSGPVVQSHAFLRAAFWPTRTSGVDAILLAERSIDRRLLEELGADAKGLFALEYLLFGLAARAPEVAASARARRYACEASAGVVAYAERAARLLGDGQDYARAFSAAGTDGLQQVVTQVADTLDLLVGRFSRVLHAQARGALRSSDVEGYFSGTSLALALELLGGTETLYRGVGGAGLSALVRPVAPAIDAQLCSSFELAKRRLQAVGDPLPLAERIAVEPLSAAVAALRALDVALKADLKSALGITLTFASSDGD